MKARSRTLQTLGPYLLVELLAPGGTLIALIMWLAARRRTRRPADRSVREDAAGDTRRCAPPAVS